MTSAATIAPIATTAAVCRVSPAIPSVTPSAIPLFGDHPFEEARATSQTDTTASAANCVSGWNITDIRITLGIAAVATTVTAIIA